MGRVLRIIGAAILVVVLAVVVIFAWNKFDVGDQIAQIGVSDQNSSNDTSDDAGNDASSDNDKDFNSGTNIENSGDNDVVDPTVELEAAKKDLTVTRMDLLPEEALCSGNTFNKKAAVDGPYKWADSVTLPFKSKNKDAMLKEIFKENCQNPVFLDTNVQGLSAVTIDGWTVGKAPENDWMRSWLKKAKNPQGLNVFLAKEGKTEKIVVTKDARETAALMNTVLMRAVNKGIVTQTALGNWHRPGATLTAGKLARSVPDKSKDKRPALRLEYRFKNSGCVLAIGFNTGDKRFETLPCELPKPKSTATKPNKSTKTTPGKSTSTPPSKSTPPKKVTPPPTHKVCPWPLTKGKCLQPKSSDPNDYVHKKDAPKATVDEGPSKPSKVTTSVTGGGGVVDTPTKEPGSPSGVTAPGADPAPTEDRDPPPAEDGAQPESMATPVFSPRRDLVLMY